MSGCEAPEPARGNCYKKAANKKDGSDCLQQVSASDLLSLIGNAALLSLEVGVIWEGGLAGVESWRAAGLGREAAGLAMGCCWIRMVRKGTGHFCLFMVRVRL